MKTFTLSVRSMVEIVARNEEHAREIFEGMTGNQIADATEWDEIEDIWECE